MNKYPMQDMAKQVEAQGRYGDDVLVHLNPIEVQGLASLSPTGRLTTNPVTGQPEAFLPLLIPLLASYGGSALAAGAGASAIGAAVAGGLASGAATAAITGDLERGLVSGIMGAGLGAAVGAAGSAGADAVANPAASDLLTGAVGGAGTSTIAPGMEALNAGTALSDEAAKQALMGAGDIGVTGTDIGVLGSAGVSAPADPGMFGSLAQLKETGAGAALKNPFAAPEGKGLMSEIMKPRTMLPMAIGSGQLAQMDAQEGFDKDGKDLEKKREEDRKAAYDDLQRGYRAAQPGVMPGISPYRGQMSNRTPPPMYAPGGAYGGAAGGLTRMAEGGTTRSRATTSKNPFEGGIPYMGEGDTNMGYGGIDPVAIQAGLRGGTNVSGQTPRGFMPGFNPEFDYFQNDPANVQHAPVTNAQDWMGMYRDNPIRRQQENTPYFSPMWGPDPADSDPDKMTMAERKAALHKKMRNGPFNPATGKPIERAAGGNIPLNTSLGETAVAPGGIANIPTEFSQPPQGPPPGPPQGPPPQAQPTQEDITMLASAMLGETENGDQIVEMFVQKYGPEVFQQVRQMILQMIQPNAQTEGMIEGPGGGMDDQVNGTIGANQPVAVSPGEYIVPADVVSGLGDGSSDAGAVELDAMAGNVRKARGGSTSQPGPIDPRMVLPA